MQPRLETKTQLWCGACRRMHDRASFGRDKNSGTGLNYTCRAIVSKRNARSHAANRDRNNQRHRERRKERKRSPDAVLWAIKKLVADARRRATQRGLEFTITLSDLDAPKICPLLGLVLVYQATDHRVPESASLDRIDNTRGYIPGNCWIISWRANHLKSDATPEELIAIGTAVAKHVGKKAAGRWLDGKEHMAFPAVERKA